MPVDLLEPLRLLRQKVRKLARTIVDDYRPFQHPSDKLFYFRLPSKPATENTAPSVTPSCTAWMALCAARAFDSFHKDEKQRKTIIAAAYEKLLDQPWDTGGLPQNNAFTVAMVARSAGFLVEAQLLDKDGVESSKRSVEDFEPSSEGGSAETKERTAIPDEETWRKCHDERLKDILTGFIESPEKAIALDPFPASPTIGYWMVDAASRLQLDISKNAATNLSAWAAKEFRRQHTLVAAAHQAMMDPVALAMAACMCKALRRLSENSDALNDELKEVLPPVAKK